MKGKNKNIKFGVFCNQMIGEIKRAASPLDLLDKFEKTGNKRLKKFWSHFMYKDEDGKTITITREYLIEQGMTMREVIEDHLSHGDTEKGIMVLNPKGSGTIYL